MRCLRLGNATVLESEAGKVLFSYEGLAAVQEGKDYFAIPERACTSATNSHVESFVPEDIEPWEEGKDELLARAQRVLGAMK